MNKLVLAFVSLCAAAAVVHGAATDTKGLITFKTYYAGNNNALVTDVASASTKAAGPATAGAAGFYAQLLVGDSMSPVMGVKVGTSTETYVIEPFGTGAKAGYVFGGDWALSTVGQGVDTKFTVVAYYAPTGKETYADVIKLNSWQSGMSKMVTVTTGGNDLPKPQPAAPVGPWGAPPAGNWTYTTTVIPEPSVIALGLLGIGAFLLRRRS